MVTEGQGTLVGRGSRDLVERMGEAANDLLASLAPDQKAKATFPFGEDGERVKWYYTPVDRGGLPLFEMDRRQQRLAHQLVATGLSRAGYVAASTIMGLETTLDALEEWRWEGHGRDPALYYVSIFGHPDVQAAWGWRFEGHHISLNYTIAGGRIVSPTPTFFGANPAEAPLSGVGVLRPLSGVEDLARELVTSLHDERRQQAIVSTRAPSDILTSNRSRASQILEPKGLPGVRMEASQQEILTALIGEYIHRMPDELAEAEAARLVAKGVQDLYFAWAGGLERGEGHYYRIQGPRFLVEYDNTQNDANHIHSVWRDPADDFGALLLAQHYAQDHQKR
jgi:hypothetical protein